MKLATFSLLASCANAATVLVTNSAMYGGTSIGWNTTVWSLDTATGDNQMVADTFQARTAWNAVVCSNHYYSQWGDPVFGFGITDLDLASGETVDLPTTSLFHTLACDPKDSSKLLGIASDFTSSQSAYSGHTSRGDAPNDAPFHLKRYDPATNTETVVGTFPASEVVWGGMDGIFSFSQDGTEVWAAWPKDECPMCSNAKKGGRVHIMDTSSGAIKSSSTIGFDGLTKGTPYFLLPDAKRGVFITKSGSTSSLKLKWADLEVGSSSIKANIGSTDATNLWASSLAPVMCGDNVIAFEKGSARIGGAVIHEVSPANGANINSVDLIATLDIEGQTETNLAAVACLTPSSENIVV